MAKYALYMSVADELHDDPAVRALMEDLLRRRVVEEGLTPVSPMQFQWSEELERRIDPYEWLPWWRKLLVRLLPRLRPEPYWVRNWALRGWLHVAEEPPEEEQWRGSTRLSPGGCTGRVSPGY